MSSQEPFSADMLVQRLCEQRQQTHDYLDRLSGDDWVGIQHPALNPPLWEWLHIIWFAEYWCLRQSVNTAVLPSWLKDADVYYDSTQLAHDRRWQIDLPSLDVCRQYDQFVLDGVCSKIQADPKLMYFGELSLHHEAMHEENFMRRAQRLRQPFRTRPSLRLAAFGDVFVAAETVMLGRADSLARTGGLGRIEDPVHMNHGGFAFDNEMQGHEVAIPAFTIGREPVSEVQFAEFIAAGGYARDEWWSEPGRQWRHAKQATQPIYWQRDEGSWLEKGHWLIGDFDQHRAPNADMPVRYLNAYEAEAYCAFVGGRLPSAAEWQAAYERLHVLPQWEWTSTTFYAYPGFVPGPYAEYSAPSFGHTRELRGHSPLLHSALCRRDFRNFFAAQRRDICAGFRVAWDSEQVRVGL